MTTLVIGVLALACFVLGIELWARTRQLRRVEEDNAMLRGQLARHIREVSQR